MRFTHIVTLAALSMMTGTALAQGTDASFAIPSGRASLIYSGWGGPDLTVETYRPENLPADAPVIFVMHGVNRNPDDYRDAWIELADACGLAIIAPGFDRNGFPGSSGYNLGEPLPGTDAVSAFDAIEPLFATMRAGLGSTRSGYSIFGHSAGAQFVHRFLMLTPDTHVEAAVVANAGWYTWPDTSVEWPYGFAGAPRTPLDPGVIAALPVTLLLGEADNDPNASNLRQTPEARAQGAHRFERGLNTAALVDRLAADAGLEHGWAVATVPGIAHDNTRMAPAAVRHLVPEHIYNTAACQLATNGD
ncbi:hypothetical protein [Maricaulis virginensis]|uniref:Hydrolase n=1 Tax=Maricaulis virginensis TaxID=144022 RepID=A0A9W6INQ7_9PROT|nr:hypothetical protein [Maricaulis virginensis]GLK52520.1 hydrolase [Maricaulis virginensis]